MKINNDFNVGDVIIRCRDFACKVYANFYQVTKVLDDKLIIHPIYSLYTSISGDGCDTLPRRDKFSDLSDECYTEEYERKYCTVKKEVVKKDSSAYSETDDILAPFPEYFRFNEDMCFTMDSTMEELAAYAGTIIFMDGEGYDPYDEETENAEVTVVCHDGERLERNFGDILKEYRSYKTR